MAMPLRIVLLLLLALPGAAPPAWSAAEGESSIQGHLLVATERLEDPNFARSVVYMVRHGAGGAFGLIVNRRIAVGPLSRLMESMGRGSPRLRDQTIAIYDGGPVARQEALLLHGDDYAAGVTIDAGPGLGLTPAAVALDDIAEGRGPHAGLLIVGHAGWAPGQLERELAEGVWIIVDADARFVLDPKVDGKWRRAMARDGQAL